MSKREVKLYITDIKDSIERIEKYTKNLGNLNEFAKDIKTIDAVLRHFSVIGEAVKNIPEEYKTHHPDVSWVEITGMRNKIIHEYFDIDEDILWQTIKEDIPQFKTEILKLLNEFSQNTPQK